jgi:aspartyl-tRNA(Asn)/glutamyl-tRNA(Gln) amidotransferase subunit A
MKNVDIIKLSALEIAEKLHSDELSSRQVVDAFADWIDKVEPKLNAFIITTLEHAKVVADKVDELVLRTGIKRAALTPENIKQWTPVRVLDQISEVAVDKNGELHPLCGVPIAVKDVVVTKGVQSTSGSKILEGWIPQYDATLNFKIKAAGLPILGKTNMDEFAMGSSTEHSAYGITHNPWSLDRIPGGSGGGSAAAVAAYEAPFAIGTDTGGSIRQPASVTGTVGMKPTYGAVSRYGLIALASSLDQAGPVTRNVADAAALQDMISGHDPHDSTSIPEELPMNYGATIGAELKGLKVGIVEELDGDGFAPEVRKRFDEAVAKIEAAGAQVKKVSCPHFKYALGSYYLIMPSEASSNLARFDGMRYGQRVEGETAEKMMMNTREELLGDEVKRRIILGTYALSSGYYDAYYGSAQKVRTLILQDFDSAFSEVDVLISPTCPTVAFKLGEKLDDPMAMYLNDIATIPANLAGVPAMSIPSGLAEDGLPAGIQMIAPQKQDSLLYRFGAALEKLLPSIECPLEID